MSLRLGVIRLDVIFSHAVFAPLGASFWTRNSRQECRSYVFDPPTSFATCAVKVNLQSSPLASGLFLLVSSISLAEKLQRKK